MGDTWVRCLKYVFLLTDKLPPSSRSSFALAKSRTRQTFLLPVSSPIYILKWNPRGLTSKKWYPRDPHVFGFRIRHANVYTACICLLERPLGIVFSMLGHILATWLKSFFNLQPVNFFSAQRKHVKSFFHPFLHRTNEGQLVLKNVKYYSPPTVSMLWSGLQDYECICSILVAYLHLHAVNLFYVKKWFEVSISYVANIQV